MRSIICVRKLSFVANGSRKHLPLAKWFGRVTAEGRISTSITVHNTQSGNYVAVFTCLKQKIQPVMAKLRGSILALLGRNAGYIYFIEFCPVMGCRGWNPKQSRPMTCK